MAPSVTPKPDAPKLNVPNPGASDLDAPVAYAELHCLSNFSFLRGASHRKSWSSRPRRWATPPSRS
ncbi:MAG TPA: hypothetical protein PKC49_13075, partial [Phycisphaerae bacterium]|nr:hypothetical protein [Phycisphaerae bacterium]